MPTFDVSFLGKKSGSGGGSNASLLSDQLQILENTLATDGNLSPGDYKLLIDTARTLQNSPGLTAAQRNNYAVKISAYQKEGSVNSLKADDDIERMNRAIASEQSQDVMNAGNDPAKFLAGHAASLVAKLNDLSEIIDRRENAGQDTTEHIQEYNQTVKEYQDLVGAKQALDGWQQRKDSNPIPGYAAYVTTNDQGEIVDVSYAKYGAKTGYAETNGMINGFQVYGKVNAKQNGNNVFVLGNQRFSAPDYMSPDPSNPTSMKVQRLVAESMQSGDSLKRGDAGYLNLDPSQVQTQSYIPRGSYFKSSSGTLYQRRDDGTYVKYLNFQPDGVDTSSLFTVPKDIEQNILPYVQETIDGNHSLDPNAGFVGPVMKSQGMNLGQGFIGPVPMNQAGTAVSPMNQGGNMAEILQGGPPAGSAPLRVETVPSSTPPLSVNANNPSPVQRAPQSFSQLASQTVNKAGKFFKDLFS